MRSIPGAILLAIFSILATQTTNAEVKIPYILSSNMVLQRNQDINVWGLADAKEKVTVHFNDAVKSIRADKDGKWLVTFPAMKAGGPYDMKIRGRNIIELNNILIGDVWICSGQSNMEWPLDRLPVAEEVSAIADNENIRLFMTPKNVQFTPADDILESEWQECNSETVLPFSAVAYFFGKMIQHEMNVPVGLLGTYWGGTNVETWISLDAISQDPDFADTAEKLKDFDAEKELEKIEASRKLILENYVADEPGIVEGNAVWADPGLDESAWAKMEIPGLWESSGLLGLDGVVWFRYKFELSKEIAEKGISLELGAIDDSDQTWVNGAKVGETINMFDTDRVYNVPAELLKEGINVIAVRVEDTGGGGGFHGNSGKLKVVSDDFTLSLAGDWKFRVSPSKLAMDSDLPISPNSNPTLLFNGMIHPLLNYPVKGAIWYQGESNAGRAYKYRSLFPMMINDWRNQWNQPDMPFFFVQLANFMEPPVEPGESTWAELREAQSMTLSLPNTGMAVAIDIGEADNIHPVNKMDVGKRLALAAMKVAYGKDIEHSGPVFKEMHINGSQAMLSFDHAGSGLMCKDRYGYLKGFSIAGADRVFHWAKAHIKGDQVRVYSEKVKEPVAVRYGWADNPDDVNLYNKEGLPASPFRTDDWPGLTQRK